ncbi:bifunctional 3,4-dihydroxy-2-butanone-4-phosphate synthase/GTP cyclohydrolase II [Pseudonocardia pini]|uniref:bifunctional 3,4-dihydroxy-2-butanone-4-phosphate synthase/GTP cyclohydrolase II n=1 Tax=Pseudonocardia pini TaxID=2758030 RepID=UPI0015F07BFD|nr:bifunctional 3,4-dihydroxy-2-butanone-4-phosphate synthase/GTP cyclohydrolase II [Pseudonocardia pini]
MTTDPTSDTPTGAARKSAAEEGHARVEAALAALRRGAMVLVVDDEDRENEGDLIMAAEFATAEAMGFMIRHTSGLLCVAVTEDRAAELHLPLMVPRGDDPRGTAFTVSVDLKAGTTTGVSGHDRMLTVRALADPATRPEHLSRPGHVFPLIARPGGVQRRAGHTESTVDLCRLAGLEPVGVLGEVTNDDGTMARRPGLRDFAREHDLVALSVGDIVRYRRDRESLVERMATGRVPSDHGEFTAVCYRSVDGTEHVALVLGDVHQRGTGDRDDAVLVRVHSECLTGDVFGSRRCDCGEQLDAAMAAIGRAGRGVVVYLRGHEGRGIGLGHKLRAYTLQDAGLDTVDANLAQGLPVDGRDYGIGAQILGDLGVVRISLMTNNPAKYRGLTGHDVEIADRVPLVVEPNPDNLSYLTTKRARMHHALGGSEVS